jgi:hypothetical protein
MADYFDQSQETEALFLEQSKQAQAAKAAAAPKLLPIGRCLNPLCCLEFNEGDQRLFCNADCAADFHKYNHL